MDPTLLIGDIVERDVSESKKPSFPSTFPTATGFPQPRQRWKSASVRQQRAKAAAAAAAENPGTKAQGGSGSSKTAADMVMQRKAAQYEGQGQEEFGEAEKRRIDRENRQRLDAMSPEEIAQAQRDLVSGLNPVLIQRLLRRANIEDTLTGPSPFESSLVEEKEEEEEEPAKETTIQTDGETQGDDQVKGSGPVKKSVSFADEDMREDYEQDEAPPAPAQMLADLMSASELRNESTTTSTHFPAPPKIADLDPSDPDFLENLHKKYFPNLAADPSKLAWMAPVPTEDSVADRESSYYPHAEIAVSALRFDFRGRFLSPRVSRAMSASKGLHHHGEAPEAAGYTVGELARLARSAVPAQRCMAFQTLGRILYRLGKGEWGGSGGGGGSSGGKKKEGGEGGEGDEGDPIAMGVWREAKKGRVLDTLNEAAVVEGGHRGSKAYAMEALWLFEKGGWRERLRGR